MSCQSSADIFADVLRPKHKSVHNPTKGFSSRKRVSFGDSSASTPPTPTGILKKGTPLSFVWRRLVEVEDLAEEPIHS